MKGNRNKEEKDGEGEEYRRDEKQMLAMKKVKIKFKKYLVRR